MEETNGAQLKNQGGSVVRIVVLLVVVACLALFPFVITNRFYISLLNEMMIYGLLAMSLDVLLGYTGLLSFMHNAYLGIGAYIVGLFLMHVAPSSIWLALLVGVVGTTIIAVPVGLGTGADRRTGLCPFDPCIRYDVFYGGLEVV